MPAWRRSVGNRWIPFIQILTGAVLLLLLLSQPRSSLGQATGIYRELFTGLDRANNSLWQLTNDIRFLNNTPTSTTILPSFRTEASLGDDYGQRVRAFVIAPATGNYVFAIASDEVSQLFLSTDENPAHKRLIAFVDPRVQPDNYTTFSSQQSSNIFLEAGRSYYIEALHKEANLIDHLSVQWRLPNNGVESPIPGSRLVYELPPLLTAVPTDLTVMEGRAANFAVETANFLPQSYRWQREGVDIPGATNRSYALALPAALTDDGALFRVFVTNRFGSTNTSDVRLTVRRDTNAPTVVELINANSTNLLLTFSEAVDPVSSLLLQNYQLGGVNVLAATPGDAAGSVFLTVPPLTPDAVYTFSVHGIRDLAAQPNTIVSTQFNFTARQFNSRALGSSGLAGSVVKIPGGVEIQGSGESIGSGADQGQLAYQIVAGNFDRRVRVASLAGAEVWAKAGLMARETLDTGSRFAATFTTPSLAGSFFEVRSNANLESTTSGSFPPSYPNTWLRLARTGSQFTGYASRDGDHWTRLGSASLNLSNRLYLALAVTSHDTNHLAKAAFQDFSPAADGPPAIATQAAESLGPSSRRTGLVLSEIMYHPRDVFLGTNKAELEFVELFNSNPFQEDLSSYRLSGDIAYTFPAGTSIRGGGFLVVARVPADVQAFYGISGVLGPFTNALPNDQGQVRLRNANGHILLDVEYGTRPPWPAAADGAGHSLVLARPSYGEHQPQAWAASDAIGGSPGALEPVGNDPLRVVVINEFLAHTDAPDEDYIELFNPGPGAVDIGGAYLSDSPNTNKFLIPSPQPLPAGGRLVYYQTELGFSLSAGGETIYLVNPTQTRVLDSIRFSGQARGVASGRYPDGAASIQELATPTPGNPNASPLVRDVVIHEIMFHPISDNPDDEYIELFNRGTHLVDLSDWRFVSGIDFTFPSNRLLAPGGYLVIARNWTNLLAHYPQLNSDNTVGDYQGSLRDGGERLALAMPQLAISADDPAHLETNQIRVVVNEVTYARGGAWGQWADGGGSSLELIDPRSDNRLAPNWADSDETGKAPWTTIEITGLLDNGGDTPTALHVMLLEEGECLLDDVEVMGTSGANLITNPGFESGTNGWLMRGNHQRSSLESEGYNSSRSLHIRASSRGDIGANKIFINLSGLAANQNGTVRAKARWLHGWPELLLRLRGSYLEATGRLNVPANLGSPGLPNSRGVLNAGPAITEVTHSPPVPAANEAVRVVARLNDPDGIGTVLLKYRIDPSATYASLSMHDDGLNGDERAGDGVFSGTLPGQPADTLVAFVIDASDGATPAASAHFPVLRADNGPARECLVHFGGATPAGSFGTYRFWITRDSITNWTQREVLSNERIPGTFIYGDQRVVYGAGARYSGSPAHQDQAAPDYSPVGTPNHYSFDLPSDDLLLGTDNFNKVHGSGNNHHDDNTLVREVTAYRMAEQLGLPRNYKRYVRMFINGARRGSLMEDTQVPNGDVVESVFPDDPDGDLFKLSIWYEFGPPAQVLSAATLSECNLNNYVTTGGVKKRARYRWSWQGRAIHGTANDYSNVFSLIDAANTPASGPFAQTLDGLADIEQWMRTFALEHAVGNWDSFGFRNEQNMFGYKPERGRWQLLIWDINIIFGGGTRGAPVPVDGDLFEIDTADTPMAAIYAHPQFRRAYWQSLRELVAGPFRNENVDPFMDARHAAFEESGVHVGSPDFIKTWISQRRAYIQSQLATVEGVPFSVSGPASFSSSSNLITLSGTAPIQATQILVDGIARQVTWTSLSNWLVRVPLSQAQNDLLVDATDAHGAPVPGSGIPVTIQYSGPLADPAAHLRIHEIQYHPASPESGFVEIFNTSSNLAFDLSGWRLRGADFTFPPGAYITNRGYLVLAANRAGFAQVYGTSNLVFGQFEGSLDNGGELLTLERPLEEPGAVNLYTVVNQVRYEDGSPWPTIADGSGPSLQLLDVSQDNSRVSNWGAGAGWFNVTRSGNVGLATNVLLFLTSAGNCFIDDITLIGPGGTNLLQNGDFESATVAPWLVGTNLVGTFVTNGIAHSGSHSLFFVSPSAGGQPATSVRQNVTDVILTNTTHTLSYWILLNTNPVTMTVRTTPGSTLIAQGVAQSIQATPGAANVLARTLPAYDPVWLNEVQTDNLDGLTDNLGEHEPWVELFNAGATTLSLQDYYLADNYTTNLTAWKFPAGTQIGPGQFLLVWVDGQPGQSSGTNLHTNFRLPPGDGTIALVRLVEGSPQITDYLSYHGLGPNLAYGSVPDGQPFRRQVVHVPSPRGPNTASDVPIFINEWEAGNTTTLADPADGDYEDWFELYNAGDVPVDLGGYTLTDTTDAPAKFRIPSGYVVPAGGFLLVWADEETGQNRDDRPHLHTNFRLASSGESISLFSPSGALVDSVSFGQQTNDVSQGRYADGASSIRSFLLPTPGAPNRIESGNTPPQISPLPDRTVTLGQTLAFTVTATDVDTPPQSLTFSLDGPLGLGATLQADTGAFRWTPTAAQTPSTTTFTVRVTDNGFPAMSSTRSFRVFVVGPPRIGGISPSAGGTVTLLMPVIIGKTYRIEFKNSLSETQWHVLGGDRIASSNILTAVDDLTGGQRFYRLLILD